MGCGSCGVATTNGKPAGCQSNGGCSSGGCNRLNVFNWLADIPLSDLGKPFPIIEVSFSKGSRKEFYRNGSNRIYEKGQLVTVESNSGFDVGEISLTGELVKLQMKKYNVKENDEFKRILHPAAERELELFYVAKDREKEILVRSRAIAKELNLEMKISEAELQADGKKITFFYTADSRVDFRELIKVFASDFKAKIEMRQIGARQEAAKVGGIGSCGRELCCSTWLSDFKTVNTTAARYQNLSINQAKLSGQCGRLKCCLNYELDTYMDALKDFPSDCDTLELAAGRAFLQKKDIFKNVMWYSFSGSNKQYPITVERAREIKDANIAGQKPDDLQAVEIQTSLRNKDKQVEAGFVNDVGQISLNSLSKSDKRRKQKAQADRKQQLESKQDNAHKPQKDNNPKQAKPDNFRNKKDRLESSEKNDKSGNNENKQQQHIAKPQHKNQQATAKNNEQNIESKEENQQQKRNQGGYKKHRPQGNRPPRSDKNNSEKSE